MGVVSDVGGYKVEQAVASQRFGSMERTCLIGCSPEVREQRLTLVVLLTENREFHRRAAPLYHLIATTDPWDLVCLGAQRTGGRCESGETRGGVIVPCFRRPWGTTEGKLN